MKTKTIDFIKIRDNIVEYFPELLWWDGVSKHERYNPLKFYKHRQGMPNEIRIEFDGEDLDENWENINLTCVELIKLGYTFAVYYVEGGRSPHIHIYDLDELEQLPIEKRTIYRNRFLTKVCPKNSEPDRGLCDEKHLCALEFAIHFKHKKPKSLMTYVWNGRNMGIDFDIKYDLLYEETKTPKKHITQKELKFGDKIRMKPTEIVKEIVGFERVFDKYKIEYRNKMALCPFHADKDRSLSFSNEKGVWKCFGCNKSGNIIHLIKFLEEEKKYDEGKNITSNKNK